MEEPSQSKEHPISSSVQIEGLPINRPIELALGAFGAATNGGIPVQIKDLSLDNTVKFLLAEQNPADGSFQFVTQSQDLQGINPNQYGIGLTISNSNQTQVSTEVQSSHSTEAVVRTGPYQLLVPQLKQNVTSLQNERTSEFQDQQQRLKFISRKLKTIKANLDELYKRAGVTAITLAAVDGEVQVSGPEHVSSLNQINQLKDIFLNAVTGQEAALTDTTLQNKKSIGKDKTLELQWPCDECNSSFTTQHNLVNHKLLSHSGLPVHKCDLCEKEFIDIAVLQKHLTTHANENVFQCKICGNSFAGKNLLNSHMKIHNTDKPYTCKLCLKTFQSTSSLQYHMNKHGNKKCICKHCNKEFTKMSSLKVHMRIHSGEQPYQCQECGKGFIVSTHLTRHLRVHSGERPYVCEVCGKRFNRSSHLRIHLRIHSGDKPYPCEICGKRFNQTVGRKKHLKTHMK